MNLRLPFPSIRIQLLLIVLVVLILPWVGIHTIREIDSLLRLQQVQSLMNTAITVQSRLEPVKEVLSLHDNRIRKTSSNSEIILSTLPDVMLIDGYSDDWPRDKFSLHYNPSTHLLDGIPDTQVMFNMIAGYRSGTLTLLFDVTDDVLYQGTTAQLLENKSDSLLLGLYNDHGEAKRYVIGSNAPGWLSVLSLNDPGKRENRIHAELQIKKGGYTMEVSIPAEMTGNTLAFALVDRDNSNPGQYAVIGNAPLATSEHYGILFQQNDALRQPLIAYQAPNRRITIIDSRGNIMTRHEDTSSVTNNMEHSSTSILGRIYRLLVVADAPVEDTNPMEYQLSANHIRSALAGNDSYQFQRSADNSEQLAVALPITHQDRVIGALVIEESIEAIAHIRQQAIFNIFQMTLLATVIVVVIILVFAGFLIGRIRRLNRQMQAAVGDDGRLHATVPRSMLGDEIGDLNRGIVDMVERLREYQRYMETMASKLSHELRTPLTVVQSSLENLQAEDNHKNGELLTRANEGLARLRMILTNLTEATRLENALKTTDPEVFNLVQVTKGCVEGYRQAYPEIEFEYHSNVDEQPLSGSPELMAQLLDKLVSNAVDFHTTGTPILIHLDHSARGCELTVENHGTALPEHIQGSMFDSMVSDRDKRDDSPHLGLGLFIVRLIAEFHKGGVRASNSENGVKISVHFP